MNWKEGEMEQLEADVAPCEQLGRLLQNGCAFEKKDEKRTNWHEQAVLEQLVNGEKESVSNRKWYALDAALPFQLVAR